jgi:hypothetical protein
MIMEEPNRGKSAFPEICIHFRTKYRASRLFLPLCVQIARGVSIVAVAVGLCHSVASQLASGPDIASWGGDVPLKSIQTTGSMSAGSNRLTLAASAGFQVGDGIIVATGGEPGRGLRGTVGVGGVWPRLAYSDVSKLNSDKSQPLNTFAWVVTDAANGSGSVYQWNGSSWNYVSGEYYFNKAIPRALVGYVCSVANGGTVLMLATQQTSCSSYPFNAAVTTSGANVYYDNAPILNVLWKGSLNSNYTYVLPLGSYAIGNEIDVVGGDPNNPLNSTIAGQGGYPSCVTTLFSPKGATSATFNTHVYNFTFRDFCMTGNVRQTGFGPNWSVLSQTRLYFPDVIETGIYLDPSPNTTVKNVTFTDTWGAVGAEASDNVIVQNVHYTANDPILIESWAFSCADTDVGCSFSNVSVTSNSGLTPGFACFRGYNCTLANVTSVNGLFDLNDSGNWRIQGARVTITPNSANVWSGIYSPIFPVTSNIGSEHIGPGGQLNNVSVVVKGYIDGTNGILGAAINNPNITIDADGSSSSYSAPNCASGAIIGPNAIVSNNRAPSTIINNMTATGAACPGQANFQLSANVGDQCNNCTGSVSGLR